MSSWFSAQIVWGCSLSVKPQLTGWKGCISPHALRGTESAEPPLPLAEILDRTGVAPAFALYLHPYSTHRHRNSARNSNFIITVKSIVSGLSLDCCTATMLGVWRIGEIHELFGDNA